MSILLDLSDIPPASIEETLRVLRERKAAIKRQIRDLERELHRRERRPRKTTGATP